MNHTITEPIQVEILQDLSNLDIILSIVAIIVSSVVICVTWYFARLVKIQIEEQRKQLEQKVKVDSANLTLKFLNDIEGTNTEEISELLSKLHDGVNLTQEETDRIFNRYEEISILYSDNIITYSQIYKFFMPTLKAIIDDSKLFDYLKKSATNSNIKLRNFEELYLLILKIKSTYDSKN